MRSFVDVVGSLLQLLPNSLFLSFNYNVSTPEMVFKSLQICTVREREGLSSVAKWISKMNGTSTKAFGGP